VAMSGRVYEREYVDDADNLVNVMEPQSAIMTQLNYQGNPEKVDTTVYSNRLICCCGNIRFVNVTDQCYGANRDRRNEATS
jgi:hypothetical protein